MCHLTLLVKRKAYSLYATLITHFKVEFFLNFTKEYTLFAETSNVYIIRIMD